MRECLNCKKEYEHKREASKFCSGKCRVKYNRDHPKEKITRMSMQAMYNFAMEALTELKNQKTGGSLPVNSIKTVELPADYLNIGKVGVLGQDGSITPLNFSVPQKALKSFEYYRAAKKEIELEEDWLKLKQEILAAPNLSEKQKNLLTTTNL